jgi:ribosomal protein L3 glutamine methyltransferase
VAEKDGLDFIERILHDASPFLKDQGILVIEMGEAAEAVESYFNLPFTWIELEHGGEGIAMIEAKHLK